MHPDPKRQASAHEGAPFMRQAGLCVADRAGDFLFCRRPEVSVDGTDRQLRVQDRQPFGALGTAGVTNFNYGDYNLTPGQTSVGAVAFQVPDGVKVSSIQWGGTFGSSAATWTVPAVSSSGTSAGAWATVSAYYPDITSKDYTAAWRLLGNSPQGGGYASFVAGYASTGTQMVTETSASGDQVSFTLTSDNPDGTVQTYAGTDTVTGGRIIAASVTQTG
jgi:hypothetical protein